MKQNIITILLIFLLVSSGLGIAAFTMSFTKKCTEGFDSKCSGKICNIYETQCSSPSPGPFPACCPSGYDCSALPGHIGGECRSHPSPCVYPFSCRRQPYGPSSSQQKCGCPIGDNWKKGKYDGSCIGVWSDCDPGLKCGENNTCQFKSPKGQQDFYMPCNNNDDCHSKFCNTEGAQVCAGAAGFNATYGATCQCPYEGSGWFKGKYGGICSPGSCDPGLKCDENNTCQFKSPKGQQPGYPCNGNNDCAESLRCDTTESQPFLNKCNRGGFNATYGAKCTI